MSNIFLSIVFYKLDTNLVIYEVDPLCCPNCGGEMQIISFITEHPVIRQILEHLGLWGRGGVSRDPPKQEPLPEVVCEPFDDGWPGYEEPSFVMWRPETIRDSAHLIQNPKVGPKDFALRVGCTRFFFKQN